MFVGKIPLGYSERDFLRRIEIRSGEYTRGEKRSRKVVAGRVSCAAAGKDRDRIGYRESGCAAYRYGANQAIGFRGLRGKMRK